jgi:hypothetical protein
MSTPESIEKDRNPSNPHHEFVFFFSSSSIIVACPAYSNMKFSNKEKEKKRKKLFSIVIKI